MKVYSETIFSFIQKVESFAREILRNEAGIKVNRTRFEVAGHSYPIHIIIFTENSKIGFFDSTSYQIGLNKSLIYTTKDSIIKDILRHELAHYLTFIFYPHHTLPHGEEFRAICEKYKWDERVSKASANLDQIHEQRVGELSQERVLQKVKKLLNLSKSANVHEANVATMRANDLILKHNLQNIKHDDSNSEKEIFIETVISAKRRNAKLSAIYDILKHFLVNPIFISSKNKMEIEVSGSLENIELASYIANFLDREFERLWKLTQSDTLKGVKAKNSFFLGIARGYDEKMNEHISSLPKEMRQELILQEKALNEDLNKIYRRLRHSSSNNSLNSKAYEQGKKKGAGLVVQDALKSKLKNKLLSWR